MTDVAVSPSERREKFGAQKRQWNIDVTAIMPGERPVSGIEFEIFAREDKDRKTKGQPIAPVLTRAAVDTAATALVFSKKPGDPHSDDKNIAITLAIEGRTPKVQTVVECVDFSAQEMLKKAGCDGIVWYDGCCVCGV